MATDASALTAPHEVDDLGTTLGAWNAMVRRAQLTDEQKLMCLLVSSYADNKGGDIHCGVVTLAVDSGRGYSTARRYLSWMRRVGLIELVREGNRRQGLSDEYRLIVSPNLTNFVHVMDPDEYQIAKDEMRAQNRRNSAARTHRAKHSAEEPLPVAADLRSPSVGAGSPVDGAVYSHVDNPDLRSPWTSAGNATIGMPSALSVVSAENGHLRSLSGSSALTQDEPPPPLYTSPEEHTSPTTTDGDLRTEAAGSKREFEDQDEDSDLRSPAWDLPTPPATQPGRAVGRASVRPANVIPLRPRTA